MCGKILILLILSKKHRLNIKEENSRGNDPREEERNY